MPLPVITQFLLAFADEPASPLVALGAARGWHTGQFLGLAVRQKVAERAWTIFGYAGPLVGEICCGLCIGTTCRLLGLMLENGVTLLESLRLTRQAIRNTHYKNLLRDLEESVINGQGLGKVLQQSDVVPISAKEMLVTAENTGNLNDVSGILGEYYEEESEAKLRQLVGILEPADYRRDGRCCGRGGSGGHATRVQSVGLLQRGKH